MVVNRFTMGWFSTMDRRWSTGPSK